MGFIQPCFIQKNTPEIRKVLEGLGYSLNNGKWMGKYLATFRIKETEEWRYVASPEWDLPNSPDIDVSVDCGTNEGLFFAIAALRDDTDKNQWLTDGDLWFICGDETCDEDIEYYLSRYGRSFHKATLQELIEHFKK